MDTDSADQAGTGQVLISVGPKISAWTGRPNWKASEKGAYK